MTSITQNILNLSFSLLSLHSFDTMGSRKSKHISPVTNLTDQQVAKICHETNLTCTEVHRQYLDFREQYPDGLITQICITSLCYLVNLEILSMQLSFRIHNHYFFNRDQDHNGAIDFIEFISLTHKLDPNYINDENIYLALLFDIYLEKRELKPLVESIYDLAGLPEDERHGMNSTHAQVKHLLNKLDKNGDKRLSKEEFLNEQTWANDERLGHFFFT
uniref:EF-hand domain-containing protein n=1 Tax=Adineta vaga TaxID=104782 RepID=D4NWE7_ADIVA|nr:hypothetical protein [Adineta vaga]